MITIMLRLLVGVTTFFLMCVSQAGTPLWTFTPDPNYPPTVTESATGTATIKYTVTNQSKKSHTLSMNPIQGITQDTTTGNCSNPFTLNYQQSCVLTLQVNGSTVPNNLTGGPVVCQQGSSLQCYQPNASDTLNISVTQATQYLITPTAGSGGTISPSTPQTVNSGSNLNFTATPNTNYQVDQWLVDGGIAQTGGSTFTLLNVESNHTVEVTFTQTGTIYTGASNGNVYFSTNNGLTWTATTIPSQGNAVNSVFASTTHLYVGSQDGFIYRSSNNGSSWEKSTSPDNSSVNSVFIRVENNTTLIYAGTQNGHVYYSADLIHWTATTIPSDGHSVNSIYISSNGYLYVGSDDGNIYFSTNNGLSWTRITGPQSGVAIKDVFVTNTALYVNTVALEDSGPYEYVYTSTNLTSSGPWTWFAQVVYSLFVSADDNTIYAGTQDGYIFSLLTGNELGFITYTKINSIFFLGSI